jgi:hypothetical protein
MNISTDTGTRVHDITYGAGTVVDAHGTHVMVRWDNGDYGYMPVTSQHWVTAEPELVENIVRLLDIKDLVRETRPAYRARIQHLKSHRHEVEAMTPDQALALYYVLDALPYDDESMYETDDDDDTLVELNAQVIPDHPLAWSWYYDMVEELNAQSVSGGEWSYCWR